jgi:predicted aspartyl protease
VQPSSEVGHTIRGLAGLRRRCENVGMGFVHVPIELRTVDGKTRKVRMLVDSGAAWSCLPERDWRALGLESERRCQFDLADGTVIERGVSECRFRYGDVEATSPVILGEKKDMALLGAVTLESLGLVLNPFERTLAPMARLLLCMSARPTAVLAAPPS